VKVRDAIKHLLDDGWYLKATKGSHRQYKHLTKPGKVTVAGHPNEDIPIKTWGEIQRQAGWK